MEPCAGVVCCDLIQGNEETVMASPEASWLLMLLFTLHSSTVRTLNVFRLSCTHMDGTGKCLIKLDNMFDFLLGMI